LLNAEDIDSRHRDDHDAVVTYKRVSTSRRPGRAVARVRNEKIAPEPRLDTAEIYPDRDEPPMYGFAAGDHHRGRTDAIEDFLEDGSRSSWFRYGLVAGSLALIAGVGILAATVGVATMLPGGPAQDDSSGVKALALNGPSAAPDSASDSDNIREIPMSSVAPEIASRPEVVAPIPRPRPEEALARVEPESAATEQPSIAAMPSADVIEPPPTSSESTRLPAPVAPPAVAELPANGGTESLISNIEETLARIDANTSVETAPSPVPQVQPPQSQPPAASPPVVMTQPGYPPTADILPPPTSGGIEPTYDVVPPAATEGGYESYSTGPVPPEPVPNAYPQAPHLYPATPGVYPSDSYSFPPESIEETEAQKPGFLRRTLAKATGAVGRVLTRN